MCYFDAEMCLLLNIGLTLLKFLSVLSEGQDVPIVIYLLGDYG